MKDLNNTSLFVELTTEEASLIKGGREASSGGGRKKQKRGKGKDDPIGHQ